MDEPAFTTISFTQNQLLAIGGVSVAIVFIMSLIKKMFNVFYPKIYNSKPFQLFLPDVAVVLGVIFMMLYKLFPEWYLNLSIGFITGNFSTYFYKTLKEKFFNEIADKTTVDTTNTEST